MKPLRQRMIHDLTIRGLAESTQKSYLQAVTGLARYYRRSPEQLSAQEVQVYLIWLHQERHLIGNRQLVQVRAVAVALRMLAEALRAGAPLRA